MLERPMDRVLRTDELLRGILGHLEPSRALVRESFSSKEAKVARGALFSAALCCRSFCEPALDVLWKYQDRFFNVLNLLPPVECRAQEPCQVTFERPVEEDDWAAFTKHANRVRTLNVHHPYSSLIVPQFRSVLYEAVLRLPRLDALLFEMDGMSLSMVQRLSTLTDVRSLCFDADCVDWDGDEPGEPGEPAGFPNLQSVEVRGKLPSINSALRLLSFPRIHRLSLVIKPHLSADDGPSVSNSSKLLDTDLSELFPSLRILHIEADGITFDTLRPILTLHHLEDIQFGRADKNGDINFEDEDVCEMARASPNLIKLTLGTTISLVHRNCLLELAQCCPRLRTLLLHLWFESAPDTDVRYLNLSNAPMEGMVVSCGLSNLSDKDKVASFVTTLFPSHPDGRPEIETGPDGLIYIMIHSALGS